MFAHSRETVETSGMDRFADRRSRFSDQLDDGIAVIPAGSETIRNHDVTHPFRQNSDFYYLTGFPEPDAVAVLDPGHETDRYLLFVRPRDPDAESWTGRRAGVSGAVERYGADAAYPIADLERHLRDRIRGRSALFYAGGDPRHDAMIQRVLRAGGSLRARTGVATPTRVIDPAPVLSELRIRKSPAEIEMLREACRISAAGHAEAMRFAGPGMVEREVQAAMEYVFRSLGSDRDGYPAIVASGPNAVILHYVDNDRRMGNGELLLIDAGAEFGYFSADITRTFPIGGRFSATQRAVYDLVLAAQQDAFAVSRPGAPFSDLHDTAVGTITTGLVDLGLLPGPVDDAIRYGWYREFFFHGTGHWLGMDVHDAGAYASDHRSRLLEPGMAFTVEPGIYLAPEKTTLSLYRLDYDDEAQRTDTYLKGSADQKQALAERRAEAESIEHAVPPDFLGIGVRIEDDVLVTPEGHQILTGDLPSEPGAVEELCAEPSRLPRLGS